VRHRSASSLLCLILGLAGCGEVTGLPSAEPIPVLQGLLLLGEPRQLLQVSWSSPTHLPYEPTDRPIDASLVHLWLVAPTGDSARFDPTGVAGQFAAVAAVSAGASYRLSGTVAARAVTAQVTLPGALQVSQPTGDTLRLPLTAEFPRMAFAWRAESAAGYQALLVRGGGTTQKVLILSDSASRSLFDIAPDTVGELLFLAPSPGAPDTARLVIFGYDPTATAFFSSTTKGNVHGAFGLFGAAAKAEKVVVWE
jgi:hypothetical protein